MGADQAGEALAEDGLRAARLGAAEPAHDQAQGDGPAPAGQVGDGAPVAAVDPVGGGPAAGATRRGGDGDEQGDGGGRSQDEVVQAQVGAGEEVESRQGGAPSGEAVKT